MIFISCNNNEGIPHCESTSDCDYEWVCVANRCRSNPCEDYYCGTGTCTVIADSSEVDERGDVYCACDENSLPYKYFSDSSYPLICTPKCEFHEDCNEAYVNFGHQIAGVCIKGQCQERNECTEDSDCPTTDICGYQMCGPKPTGGK
jgi:hypothetical protein